MNRFYKFASGVIVFCLSIFTPVFAADMAEKDESHILFRVGVTSSPMYTLASALAYGSPVKALLVEKNEQGLWDIPQNLTVLFWGGEVLEPQLTKILVESGQASVPLIDAAGLHQLARRTPAEWKKPGEDKDPHMESIGKGYGMVQTIRPEGDIDTYYWLDPLNAMAALEAMTMVLQGLDQRNHWAYQANSDQIIQALWDLDIRINKSLHDVSSKPFLVLQDEFQYLEQRYRLTTIPAGGSAENIVNKAKERGAKCVVAARPLDQHLKSVLDQADLNSIVLDPAGRQMPKTTGAYFEWFGNMTSSLKSCVTSL